MSTSISSVNAGTTAATESTSAKKSQLSTQTKNKLEALGITATDGMTETEAQALIAAKESANSGGQQQQENSTESEILAEAKSLASLVGVSVSSDADVSEILDDISSELEDMLEDAENNPAVLSQLSNYLSQLSSLDERYDSLQSTQSSMYAAMNQIGENNKLALGLN